MRLLTATLLTAIIPAITMADTPPPANAMALSAVITALEQRLGDQLAYIDELDWDDDGYWEIEYKRTDGASGKVKLDPLTGEPRN